MTLDLAERVLRGDVRSASRLMRSVEDGSEAAVEVLRALWAHTGRAYVVGITGPPGAGKSTLTDRVIALLRGRGKTVGVLAVDPSSPFTGGAILGDRVRMQAHATDPHVFIRSLATRGHLGGVSRATGDCIRVMDAMGKDVVLVETVGVGQDEIEIAQMAHTTVVVLTPGMGDDIQAIKAGILEVADLFAVNKADRDGADRTVRELTAMLELRHAVRVNATGSSEWEPPILKVVAAKDQGVTELWDAVERHRDHLDASGERAVRDRARASAQFMALLKERLMRSALAALGREKGLDAVAAEIAERRADPYALADALARKLKG